MGLLNMCSRMGASVLALCMSTLEVYVDRQSSILKALHILLNETDGRKKERYINVF